MRRQPRQHRRNVAVLFRAEGWGDRRGFARWNFDAGFHGKFMADALYDGEQLRLRATSAVLLVQGV